MTPDTHPDDLIGAFVIEACSDVEAQAVADHASHCPTCTAEIDRLRAAAQLVGAISSRRPPRELRGRVLGAALAARSPCAAEVDELLIPYVKQVSAFDRLLGGLSEPQWRLPVGPHLSVHDLVVHLRGNDELVGAVAGRIPQPSYVDARRDWHQSAEVLVRTVADEGPPVLERQVRLAGRGNLHRPLREALTQRAFETWIHAEDVRALLDLPPDPPSGDQIARIVDFGLRLLPGAMDAAGRGRPHEVIRLTLTGPGGGERLVALSATSPTTGSMVVAEITLRAELFCRLMAGRVHTPQAGAAVTGDLPAAQDFLGVAATMGCD